MRGVEELKRVSVPDQYLPNFVSLENFYVYYFGLVTKNNKKWHKEQRVVVVTSDYFFTASRGGDIRRSISVTLIRELLVEPARQMVALRVPDQYDVCVETPDFEKLSSAIQSVYYHNAHNPGRVPLTVRILGDTERIGSDRYPVALRKPPSHRSQTHLTRDACVVFDEVATPPDEHQLQQQAQQKRQQQQQQQQPHRKASSSKQRRSTPQQRPSHQPPTPPFHPTPPSRPAEAYAAAPAPEAAPAAAVAAAPADTAFGGGGFPSPVDAAAAAVPATVEVAAPLDPQPYAVGTSPSERPPWPFVDQYRPPQTSSVVTVCAPVDAAAGGGGSRLHASLEIGGEESVGRPSFEYAYDSVGGGAGSLGFGGAGGGGGDVAHLASLLPDLPHADGAAPGVPDARSTVTVHMPLYQSGGYSQQQQQQHALPPPHELGYGDQVGVGGGDDVLPPHDTLPGGGGGLPPSAHTTPASRPAVRTPAAPPSPDPTLDDGGLSAAAAAAEAAAAMLPPTAADVGSDAEGATHPQPPQEEGSFRPQTPSEAPYGSHHTTPALSAAHRTPVSQPVEAAAAVAATAAAAAAPPETFSPPMDDVDNEVERRHEAAAAAAAAAAASVGPPHSQPVTPRLPEEIPLPSAAPSSSAGAGSGGGAPLSDEGGFPVHETLQPAAAALLGAGGPERDVTPTAAELPLPPYAGGAPSAAASSAAASQESQPAPAATTPPHHHHRTSYPRVTSPDEGGFVQLPWGRGSPAGQMAEREHQRAQEAELRAAQLLGEIVAGMEPAGGAAAAVAVPQAPPASSATPSHAPSARAASFSAATTAAVPPAAAAPLEVSVPAEPEWFETLTADQTKSLKLALACDTAAAIAVAPHCVLVGAVRRGGGGGGGGGGDEPSTLPFALSSDVADPSAAVRRFAEVSAQGRMPIPETMRVLRDLGGLQTLHRQRRRSSAGGGQQQQQQPQPPPPRRSFAAFSDADPRARSNSTFGDPVQSLPLPPHDESFRRARAAAATAAAAEGGGVVLQDPPSMHAVGMSPKRRPKHDQASLAALYEDTKAIAHGLHHTVSQGIEDRYQRELEQTAMTNEISTLKHALVDLTAQDAERSRRHSNARRGFEEELVSVRVAMESIARQGRDSTNFDVLERQRHEVEGKVTSLQREMKRLEEAATEKDLRSNDEKRLLENQLLHLRAAISEIESEKGGHQNRRHLDAELASLRSKLREMEGAQIVAEATSDDDRRSLAAQLASLQHEVAAAGQREAARADGLLRYAQEGDSHVLQELQRVRGAVSERRARMEDELRSVRERLQAKERTMTADTHRLEAELQAMKRGMLDLNEAQSAALLRDRDALEGDLVSVKAHLARMVDEQAVERARAEAAARDVLGQAEAIAHGGRARAAAETEQKLATLEVELHRHHNAEAEQLQATYTTMLDGVEGQVKALHEALLQSQEREHAASVQMAEMQRREQEAAAQLRLAQEEAYKRDQEAHAALAESEARRQVAMVQQRIGSSAAQLPPLPPPQTVVSAVLPPPPSSPPRPPPPLPPLPQAAATPQRRLVPVPTPAQLEACPEHAAAMAHLSAVYEAAVREAARKEERLQAVVALTDKTRDDEAAGEARAVRRLHEAHAAVQAGAAAAREELGEARAALVAAREQRLQFLQARRGGGGGGGATPHTPRSPAGTAQPSVAPAAGATPGGLSRTASPVRAPASAAVVPPATPGTRRLTEGFNRLSELQRELESAQADLHRAGTPRYPPPRVSPASSPQPGAGAGAGGGGAGLTADFPSEQEILANLKRCLDRSAS